MHTGCCCGEEALWAPDTSPRSPAMALALTQLRPSRVLCLCPRHVVLSPPRPAQLTLQLSLKCRLCWEVFPDHSV